MRTNQTSRMILGYERDNLMRLNNAMIGAFFDGNTTLGENLDLGYRLEYAIQNDVNNPNDIDADYIRADLGVTVPGIVFELGYEALSGSERDGQFRTPLATLHTFNGWADKFLNTPTDGLQDFFISVTATVGRFKLMGTYHDFSADSRGRDWGSETDAAVIYTAP